MNKPRCRAGFTLVEILITVGIIAVLAGILTPVIISARNRANIPVCISNLRQIGAAAAMYQSSNEGFLPVVNPRQGITTGPFGRLEPRRDPLERYGAKSDIYHCPRSTRKDEKGYQYLSDYLFRFVIDFSQLNKNKTAPFRLEPQPGSVIGWDWNHLAGDDIITSPGNWLVLHEDSSVSSVPYGRLKKSYLRGGAWSFTPPGDRGYYEFVFPGEPWPPVLTPIQ
jgi:prepilin-type N-terminal cleavage/methylation domain-containing protein